MKRLYIGAHAKRKSDELANLEEMTLPCMEALAQLWLFPSTSYVNHWRREVWGYYKSTSRIKPKNKYLKQDDIFNETWILNSEKFNFSVQCAIEHESELNPDKRRLNNLQKLKGIMENYFQWVSTELSNNGYISPDFCYKKLEELGL